MAASLGMLAVSPFGIIVRIIVGIFTIIVMVRPSVNAAFDANDATDTSGRVVPLSF